MNSSGAFALVVEVMFSIGNNAGYRPVSFESRLKAFQGYKWAWIRGTIVFESCRLQACIRKVRIRTRVGFCGCAFGR